MVDVFTINKSIFYYKKSIIFYHDNEPRVTMRPPSSMELSLLEVAGT